MIETDIATIVVAVVAGIIVFDRLLDYLTAKQIQQGE